MPRFRWHAHYFDGIDGNASCVRKTIIEADYGDEAEKIAQAQMGLCERVEVKRFGTSAPARVVYAAKQAIQISPLAEIFVLPGAKSPNVVPGFPSRAEKSFEIPPATGVSCQSG